MHTLLDPTLDIVFKLLFTRDPESHDALVGLLNAVLRPAKPVSEVVVLNPGIGPEAIEDKGVALDLLVRFVDGTSVNAEMQTRHMTPFRERLLYYWARLFGQQLSAGDHYTALRPTISIAFLAYREPNNPRFHSVFQILERSDHAPYTDALAIHLVQLPRLSELSDTERRDAGALLSWGRLFAARTPEELSEAAMKDPAVSKARDILQRLSADPEARRLAEARELAQITRRLEDTALREEAEAVGEERGIRLGEERGVRLGEERARREAVRDLCAVLGIPMDERREAELVAMDADGLAALLRELRTRRSWGP